MALKLLQQLSKQLGQMGICRYALICSNPKLLFSYQPADILCVACLCTSSTRCFHNHGRRKLRLEEGTRRELTTVVCEPPLVGRSSFVGLQEDSVPRLGLTQMHQPTTADQETLYVRLKKCSSSRQVFRLLNSIEMTDTMAAVFLHRVADLEQGVNCLKDPTVLEQDIIKALCQQLEEKSERLTDSGVISALLACTRLYLDPRSTLMVRLVSESQKRLDQGHLNIMQLCDLGKAILAMEGSSSLMLKQVMSQIQIRDVACWTVDELSVVYKLLQLGKDMTYHRLLNAMHTHAVTVASHMNPATVSELLSVLTSLNKTRAMPLIIHHLCKKAAQHVPHFTDEELTLVLSALMHFSHSDHDFVDAMEKYVPSMAFTSHPETVSKVMQFFGKTNILSPVVFDAVAESFVYRADDYTTSQVASQIIPFGKLGYLPPNASDLFRKAETILHSRFSQFQPLTLLNMLHSCTLIERFPLNFVSKVFSCYFLQQLQEEGSGMNRYVLSQLTQLYLTLKLECPFYQVPQLPPQYRVKSFVIPYNLLETPLDIHFYTSVKSGLLDLLGAHSYFSSRVKTRNCYTLDVEIKLDEEGYVLPASYNDVFKRIALCIDGQQRFTSNKRQLLGQEAMKQRHLRLLGYEVIQIPFYEFEKLQNKTSVVEYLHQKIFPHSFRLSW